MARQVSLPRLLQHPRLTAARHRVAALQTMVGATGRPVAQRLPLLSLHLPLSARLRRYAANSSGRRCRICCRASSARACIAGKSSRLIASAARLGRSFVVSTAAESPGPMEAMYEAGGEWSEEGPGAEVGVVADGGEAEEIATGVDCSSCGVERGWFGGRRA